MVVSGVGVEVEVGHGARDVEREAAEAEACT